MNYLSLYFLKLNLGNWVTLRTSYFLHNYKMHVHKSKICISNYDHKISSFCQPKLDIYRSNINQNITQMSYFLVNKTFADTYKKNSLDHWMGFLNKASHISYMYNAGDLVIYEKSWFVNSNLRLNIDTIYKKGKCVCVSFSSDIKIV
uniref:Uncharacterized protein n=1 Tax=Neoizziella asiatica TaxID=1077397 RepID=A0A1G4NXC9_9FLOR|nr:Hypothetical protein ycf58 [Neoizziella asiatica]SCW23169.1 Hypothetical protein ycf58 [Neoizziella asiatica]